MKNLHYESDFMDMVLIWLSYGGVEGVEGFPFKITPILAMTEVLSDTLVRIYHRYNSVEFDHVLFISNSM